jgi:hypothetical protein
MINGLLIVLIIILLVCKCSMADKMCPYPGVQRFSDPYKPTNIGLLGREACCGRRDPFTGCCGGCNTCLPDYAGCTQNNQLAGGQLPCESIGNFWFPYSRLIDGKQAWSITDAKGWSMRYDDAVAAIPIGSIVCWNGQPMARVVAIKQHVNLPNSAFVVLDQTFKIDLAGNMVTILPSNAF